MTIKQDMKELDKLYKLLADETGELGLDIVSRIVDLEISIEKECNQ